MDLYEQLDMLGRIGGGFNSAVLTIDRRVLTPESVKVEVALFGGEVITFFGSDIAEALAEALDYFVNKFVGDEEDCPCCGGEMAD